MTTERIPHTQEFVVGPDLASSYQKAVKELIASDDVDIIRGRIILEPVSPLFDSLDGAIAVLATWEPPAVEVPE